MQMVSSTFSLMRAKEGIALKRAIIEKFLRDFEIALRNICKAGLLGCIVS